VVFYYHSRVPIWHRLAFALAILAAVAAFLWMGLFLAVGSALLLGSSILVHRIRGLWARRRRRVGPITVEGHYRRIDG